MDFYDWLIMYCFGTNGLMGEIAKMAYDAAQFPRGTDYEIIQNFFFELGFSKTGLRAVENCWTMFTSYRVLKQIEEEEVYDPIQ